MKLELEFQVARNWSIKKIKELYDNAEDQKEALYAALELQSSYDDLLERAGFSRYWNKVIYGSDEFYRALDIAGNDFGLQFLVHPKLTKKELDTVNAFVVKASSILPLKHDIIYAVGGNWKSLPPPCEYVPLRDDIYKIYIYKHTGIVGKYEKWKDEYFKSTEYLSTNLIVTNNIKRLISQQNITGLEFEPLLQYNLKTKRAVPIEGIYDSRPTHMLQHSFLANMLLSEESRDEPNCIFFNQEGAFIFKKGAFEGMRDFMLMNLPTSEYMTSIVASQRFRRIYLKNKLKGLSFMPMFETNTELFCEYDSLISKFAQSLSSSNSKHRVGYELINPKSLTGGLKPKELVLKNE